MIKKTKGFTLLETILAIGIITLLISTVYTVADKRHTTFLAEKQARYVDQIITSLDDYLITVSDADNSGVGSISGIVTPPTQLISERIIPEEMAASANTLKTVWGDDATISAVTIDNGNGVSVSGYEISLTGIPLSACTKFASQALVIKKAQRLIVNGTVVKSPGGAEPNSALIASSCVNTSNTVNIAANAYKRGIDPIVQSNAAGYVRNKENKYYIAPMGTATSTSGAPSCVGGSSWNATVGACICSSTTHWNGASCVPQNQNTLNQAGQCNFGQFWNQQNRACQVICPSNQVYNPTYHLNNPSTNGCVGSTNTVSTLCIPGVDSARFPIACQAVVNKVASNSIYSSGRHMPDSTLTTIIPAFSSIATNTTLTPQIVTSMPVTNTLGGSDSCPLGARATYAVAPNNTNSGTTTNPVPNFDGKVCQMCVNGTWDGDRCVTN